MKIGIITDPMGESVPRGYVKNLVESLFKVYDPNHIYLIHAKRVEDALPREGKKIIIPRFCPASFPSAQLWDIFRPLKLRKYKLDIIHYTWSYAPLTFFIAGSKNVCLLTTLGPITHPRFYPWPSRYMARLAKLVYRKMDILITETEYGKKEIIKLLRVPEHKVKVIPSGVEEIFRPLNNLDEIKNELSTKYKIKFPYILHVSTYRPVKNGPALIMAFGELKRQGIEHKLVLVGKPAQKFEEVQRLIRELGLEKEVIITGFVPDEDLPKFYNAADLFVLPSFKESFGHVLVEAMACGCPVVTSNVTAMPEVVGDAGILIDPYDVDSLAEGIYKVLTNFKLRQELKRKSLQKAKFFSWEKCARETLKVYEELYKGKGKS